MSDCCDGDSCSTKRPTKLPCPRSGQACNAVEVRTILHHLARPWKWEAGEQTYYFCDDPRCEVVYFGGDGETILQDSLRTPVGIKTQADDALICYCFGVTRAQACHDPAIKAYVVEQTKTKHCACDIRNPSGRCCLKDFPRP